MTDLNGNGGKYCNHAKCISAPCVRLASSSRSEDSSRGFNIIRLKKKDGVIIDVSARYFQIVVADVYSMLRDSVKDILKKLMEAELDSSLDYGKKQKGDIAVVSVTGILPP